MGNEVICSDCESCVTLNETPYDTSGDYMLECDCKTRVIDVTSCVDGSALLEPVTGKWSNFDADNPNR
jgi:hypothetical protein